VRCSSGVLADVPKEQLDESVCDGVLRPLSENIFPGSHVIVKLIEIGAARPTTRFVDGC
jgi:hypothetical protein